MKFAASERGKLSFREQVCALNFVQCMVNRGLSVPNSRSCHRLFLALGLLGLSLRHLLHLAPKSWQHSLVSSYINIRNLRVSHSFRNHARFMGAIDAIITFESRFSTKNVKSRFVLGVYVDHVIIVRKCHVLILLILPPTLFFWYHLSLLL